MISASRIEHQPVFKVDNITIAGGRPSIKMEMASSVIYDIISGGGPNLQADTLAEVAKDSFVTSKLLDKIKELETALSSKASVQIGAPAPEAQPAFIPGIVAQAPEPTPVAVVAPVAALPAPVQIPVVAPVPVVAAVPEPMPIVAPLPLALPTPEPLTLSSIMSNPTAVAAQPPVLPLLPISSTGLPVFTPLS